MTDPTPEELDALVSGWAELISETEVKISDDMEDAVETGERPDLWDYNVFVDLDTARATMVAITALRAQVAETDAMIAAAYESAAAQSHAIWMQLSDGLGIRTADAIAGSIRAVTPSTARDAYRAAIVAAERAGYERGLREATPQFGKEITMQQAARMMLQSHTVQAMVAAGRPLDLVAALTEMAHGDKK